ncbi:RING-H2 finger protein ATL80-like [Miscanthus floridulus]|uniref:RING-H2 finger protein ATL80-like n=1 Tax=Miscanthus floridulus TaxID=154761 RepID=UPI0034582672
MASPARRLLQTNSAEYPTLPAAEPPSPLAVDSDVVVILAALLCALICVVGLAAVARCARSRAAAPSAAQAAARRGLKKKALRALPSLAYEDAVAAAAAGAGEAKVLAECAICLSEFAPREEVRVLPQCGHAFHVACIDTWLAAHSSCPSCRRVLVVADAANKRPPQPKRCRKCDAAMDEEASSSSGSGGDMAAGS